MPKRPFPHLGAVFLTLVFLSLSCGAVPPPDGDPRPIFIRDRRGEHFDITHAVRHYGMARGGFRHGIGKTAFPKLENPGMLLPGQAGFPTGRQRRADVIGIRVADDARSYRIDQVVRHEIVNDVIGGSHAAVAY